MIGSGVSGLTAAYVLNRSTSVTLYESDTRLGGHAHTHCLSDVSGNPVAIDTGFIVHNDRTYPLLQRLFRELNVPVQPTEMSMSITDESSQLEFAGGRGGKGVFAQPSRIVDRHFLVLLLQVKKFHKQAKLFLETTNENDQTTYGEFLRQHGFTARFVRLYATPVVSCVWSMGEQTARDYPARYLFQFLENHGLLSVKNSPQWYTVVGGSGTYVAAISRQLPEIRCGVAVAQIQRDSDGANVLDQSGQWTHFDAVVVATHADHALAMLVDATDDEKAILGAFSYSRNETVLHNDERLLPTARQARASWNYRVPPVEESDRPPIVTYWMNHLQGLPTQTPYLVTLNGTQRIDPSKVLAIMHYEHPIYDLAAVTAQKRLATLSTSVTAFAGAYHGWGFHEDGCRSGVQAAQALGAKW